MIASKEKQRDDIINTLSLHSIEHNKNQNDTSQNQEIATENIQQLTPEQNLVFSSIQSHFPDIVPDLVISYT